MNQEPYTPTRLCLWRHPDHYTGELWPGYYVFLGRSRDSDCLVESNFFCALKEIGGESEENGIHVVRELHWAHGWVEWIAIHQDNYEALRKADEIMKKLGDYPVLNEDDWREREYELANQVWRDHFTTSSRINYIRENRDQFNFYSISEMMDNARGKYFSGDIDNLIN